MTRLYIVRHCEARGNIDRIFQGHTDADISEKGARQLEKLAQRFAGIPLDAVYTSPLRRARLTADAVNRAHGLPVHIEQGLIEIDGGALEGKPWANFPQEYPAEARAWCVDPGAFQAPGGESMREVYERVRDATLRIVRAHPGQTVAAASHGCAIRNLLCFAHGLPVERIDEIEWCDNTAVSLLEFGDDLVPKVVFENDTSHLSDELSTLSGQSWWKKENLMNLKFE